MSRSPSTVRRLLDDTRVVGVAMLVGAAIVLWLAFQAQTGQPWEATKRVEIAVPDGGKLMRNADVRIGGARVGQVLSIEAVPREGRVPPHAVLDVQLEADHGDLPVDSTAEVRLASVLGGKYVSLVPGDSEDLVPDGGRLALKNAVSSVDIEDALAIFDPEGRQAMRRLLGGLGDATAGRGGALNATIGEAVGLMPPLQRVLRSLAAERTDLPGFVAGLASATTALEGVAPELAALVGDADITFAALDDAGDAVGDSLAELPLLGRDATRALRTIDPVLGDAAAIAEALQPAADVLEESVESTDATMRIATRVAPKLGTLADPVDRTLGAVDEFASNPSSTRALELLGTTDLATFGTSAFVGLGAILATTWEAEEHCRTVSSWTAQLADVASDGDEGGNWIRMIPVFQLEETLQSGKPAPELHANPYPIQNAQECEAGNEGFAPGQQIGNPPGLQGAPEAGR